MMWLFQWMLLNISKERCWQNSKELFQAFKKDGFAIIGTPNVASKKFASKRRLNSHPFEFDYDFFEDTLSKAFKNVFVFTMTDEIVSTQFQK